ncbi:MAG: N-formylglutamate amidohydrolase [Rhodobacteraceae bacterium]|nr:N-formylglutamate amidohydrolase [Paracoccaceae bacterium]
MKHSAYILESDSAPRSCAVFSSPHSGAEYSAEFLQRSCLTPHQLRSSEDAYVDQFIGETLGAPVLKARFPRAYVDLNRAPDELDPAIIHNALGMPTNPRIAAGLGVIPRVVANGRAIQLGKMKLAEAEARLKACYIPYHTALRGLIEAQRQRFGTCFLIDIHSMPRSALTGGLLNKRAEIVLGDRYGTAADPWVTEAVATFFTDAGFEVARNAPFAGGYITRHYGAPSKGVHVVQIEIDRSLYMNESRVELHRDFEDIRARISGVLTRVAGIPACPQSLAAE